MVNWASGSYGEAGLDRMPAVESSKHCSKSHHRVRERSLLCLCLSFSNSNSFPLYSVTISLNSSFFTGIKLLRAIKVQWIGH